MQEDIHKSSSWLEGRDTEENLVIQVTQNFIESAKPATVGCDLRLELIGEGVISLGVRLIDGII